EIGAGMGRTAYYAHRFGLTDYTIVDLPHMLIGQACFLAATLGEDRVWLMGEPKVDDAIRLLPPQSLQPTDCFDVVLNADSMTEMNQQGAERYLSFITSRCSVFISINHEANEFTVHELFGSTPHMRHPYPLRPGYLEEIWTVPNRGITALQSR